MEYNGITLDSLFLLAENRFRDSKPFYEEHKEQLKAYYQKNKEKINEQKRIAYKKRTEASEE